MVRTNAVLRELIVIALCLALAVWLSSHSLGGLPTPRAHRNVPRPFASRNLEFSAKKMATVWLRGKTEATVYRVYHHPPDDWRIEYLAPKEACGRIMLQSNHTIWQVEPSRKRIFVTSCGEDIENYEKIDSLLSKNYSAEKVSTATEAHRKCSVLRLVPKHAGKSRWLIWLDDQTGVIIKRERYGADGGIEQVSQYTEFRPGKVDPDLFDTKHLPRYPVVNQKWTVKHLPKGEIQQATGLDLPESMPGGFELKSAFRVGDSKTVQLSFSDGLCVASLFVSSGSPARDIEEPMSHPVKIGSTRGRSTTFGHMTSLTWESHGRTYTLVADISESVMLDMATSLL